MIEKETEIEAKGPEEFLVQSADELMSMLSESIDCKFYHNGKRVRIPVTPMSASTAEKVRELRRKALPPFKRERGPTGNYDELDPVYLKNRDDNEKKARALIIYAHCPIVSAKKPGLVAVEDIYAFVQTLFTELILEIISTTIQAGGVSTTEERVDFTLAGGSDT